MSANTEHWKKFARTVPFLLLFGVLSVVHLLAPIAAPALAGAVEPERFDWLFSEYPQMLLEVDPQTAETVDDLSGVAIGAIVCAAVLFFPFVLLTYMHLVWLPTLSMWDELEEQRDAGIIGFLRVGVSALLPFVIALVFAFVLGGTTRGAIAYGACTLFLPQVVYVLVTTTTAQLMDRSSGSPLFVVGYWIVAIPICLPAYLAIFVLESSPLWWAIEHAAMLLEVLIFFRVAGRDRGGEPAPGR